MHKLHQMYLVCLVLMLTACTAANDLAIEKGPTWDRSSATAGIAIFGKLASRNEHDVYYGFEVRGAPSNKVYSLWARWLDGEVVKVSSNLRVNSSTHILGTKKALILNSHHMYKGEPVAYQLISNDGEIKGFTQVIPFPLEGLSKGNCRLVGELASKDGLTFNISAEGFSPNEVIQTKSVSGDELISNKSQVSRDGTFVAIVLPGVIGKTGGPATFTAIGNACSVTLTYKWGTAMIRQ